MHGIRNNSSSLCIVYVVGQGKSPERIEEIITEASQIASTQRLIDPGLAGRFERFPCFLPRKQCSPCLDECGSETKNGRDGRND